LEYSATVPVRRHSESSNIGAERERRPKPLVQEVFESTPGRGAIIFFELVVPQLRDVVQMVRGHPNTFLSHGAMVAEVRLAFVDEQHRIDRAIKAEEVPLFVLDERILVALPVVATTPSVVRGRRGLVLHGRHIGLQR
jgi:hypothetical protein